LQDVVPPKEELHKTMSYKLKKAQVLLKAEQVMTNSCRGVI